MYRKTMSTGLALTLLAAAGAGRPAAAATILKTTTQTGTASCAPALPTYEGVIRKRPLAIQNEGASSAFVSCSLTTSFVYATAGSSEAVYLGFTNSSSGSSSVTCTLVDIGFGASAPTYRTKTFSVQANGSREVQWNAANDNGGVPFRTSPNISCNLTPGIGITYTASLSADQVGN